MPVSIDLVFTKAPSLLTIGLSILRGYRFSLDTAKPFPAMTARRHGIKPDAARLADFARICGIKTGESLPLVYPLTYIYPLVQIMLAHKEVPLSLLNTLNIRTQIIRYRPILPDETCDVCCRLARHRVLEKGLEVDIACALQIAGVTVWESTITFYFRGRFGSPEADFVPPQLEAIPDAPEIACWFLPAGIGFAFAKLSGDGNPIHFWKFYAKMLGFARDFAQPLLVLTKALSYLDEKPSRGKAHLDIAFKGPAYYGRNACLKAKENTQSERFDIYSEGNPRPCICGDLQYG
ncbi:MAG: hypothetical protein CVU71_04710 [Deltaproteobacteria bacterium HGW-Deltaproteobacteria-6]|nr:MAG: hypothetical protein CVU71_04710 [Deltaproteobacteria bacterium HGW-Deltaproteobacteria-6]